MTIKDYYNNEVRKKLMEELKIDNLMAVPKVTKIVVNVGAGEATSNKVVLDKISEQLSLITGQKPVITKARVSISAFKLRKGQPIGVKVTLRGKKMYYFLEKIIKIIIPRFKDFRGVSETSIDQHGNLNLGITEQTLFPEIDFDKIDKIRGLQVTVVTNARDFYKGKKLFELLGIPFKKDKVK
ncbi:MAG: 50S ribosomal protein L5 [Patescibacteria group bacterium]|nr:MAG: 50S ribosomal protein L5 [Patescibacteria group bacterium]